MKRRRYGERAPEEESHGDGDVWSRVDGEDKMGLYAAGDISLTTHRRRGCS